jgi:hypothetical protein
VLKEVNSMAQVQKPNPKNFATIGKLKEIIAQNNIDKKYIEDKRKAYGTDMSNADEGDLKDQVRLAQIEDQNRRYGALITKANKEASAKATKDDKATPDSTRFFGEKAYKAGLKYALASGLPAMRVFAKEQDKATSDMQRQKLKGKPGYDKNGYPLKNK